MPDIKVKEELEPAGYALASTWGGPKKKRYFTPDGKEIWAIPAIREFVRKDAEGKVIEAGERDANYDQGWLETMPLQPKLSCPTCGKWHDTEEEVNQCKLKRENYLNEWERKAKRLAKETKEEQGEIGELRTEVAELKALLAKMIGGQGGQETK